MSEKRNDNVKPVSFALPESTSELLDAIVMADTHKSKSEIVREALEYYINEHLDCKIKEGAENILKIRRKTLLKSIKKKDHHEKK